MTRAKEVTAGSGNVFEDLGYANPQEHQTKARLVSQIAALIAERKLTQSQAAELFGIDQPKVSALLHGRFRGFSVYRIMAFLTALGRDVEIVSKAARGAKSKSNFGEIVVR